MKKFLFLLLLPLTAFADCADITWTAPQLDTTGKPAAGITGYRIEYGTTAQLGQSVVRPAAPLAHQLCLPDGLWYFAMRTVTATEESVRTNLATKLLVSQAPPPTPTPTPTPSPSPNGPLVMATTPEYANWSSDGCGSSTSITWAKPGTNLVVKPFVEPGFWTRWDAVADARLIAVSMTAKEGPAKCAEITGGMTKAQLLGVAPPPVPTPAPTPPPAPQPTIVETLGTFTVKKGTSNATQGATTVHSDSQCFEYLKGKPAGKYTCVISNTLTVK